MKINFNTKTTYGYNDKYIKTKAYKDSIITNFIIKMGLRNCQKKKYHTNVIILHSIIYAYEKYYPQVFLEECKYVKENKKIKNYIDVELESESDSDTDSDKDIDIDIDIDNEE